jgi:hypothetical protein
VVVVVEVVLVVEVVDVVDDVVVLVEPVVTVDDVVVVPEVCGELDPHALSAALITRTERATVHWCRRITAPFLRASDPPYDGARSE